MGKVYPEIETRLAKFIENQHLFFVATAPLAGQGLINLSPKGLDTFSILDPHTVAYLDLVGSGVETVAHLRENGRIVLMFCAFEGPPNIVRLHGSGEAVEPGDDEWDDLIANFPARRAARSVVRVAVDRISDSCGFGVPLYSFQGERDALDTWAEKRGDEGLRSYRNENNRKSVDGLPGLRREL
jgi:hypothetical protein